MEKSERERMVFQEFASCVGIPLESIWPRKEPEPDILCSFGGESVYFELTLGTDQVAEKTMAKYDKSGEAGGIGSVVDVFEGVCSILKSKLLTKTYETPEAQAIHLLVYVEFGMERLLMKRLGCEAWLKESVRNGPFAMIWFYDRGYPPAPVGQIERAPFLIRENPEYARYDFRVSWMRSSVR
jgi:hypothetical protein